MKMINTPLDALNFFKGKIVNVELTDGTMVRGKLLAFDLTINLSIETDKGVEFLQGSRINFVSLG
jgi:small nuclear ribonucleoprotein (snRNP)-like protein